MSWIMGIFGGSKLLGYIGAAVAALVMIIGIFMKGQSAGINKEKIKQQKGQKKARDVANKIEQDSNLKSDEEIKKDLNKWARD